MTNYIYRAQVQNDGKTITYHNSQGKKVTYSPKQLYMMRDAALLFNTVNKYFTGKSPNITPQEQVQIRADIAKASYPMGGIETRYRRDKLNIFEGIDFVLKTFSDKNSEGGENITPNEVYQMFECFHNWTTAKPAFL